MKKKKLNRAQETAREKGDKSGLHLTRCLHWKGIGVNVSTYDHIISEYICINSVSML